MIASDGQQYKPEFNQTKKSMTYFNAIESPALKQRYFYSSMIEQINNSNWEEIAQLQKLTVEFRFRNLGEEDEPDRYPDLGLRPIHFWGAIEHYSLIISEEALSSFQNFTIPNFQKIPLDIHGVQSLDNYYLLVFRDLSVNEISFSQSVFSMNRISNNEVVHKLAQGEISKISDLQAIGREYRKQFPGTIIKPYQIKLKKDFDLAWGWPLSVIFSETLKNHLKLLDAELTFEPWQQFYYTN